MPFTVDTASPAASRHTSSTPVGGRWRRTTLVASVLQAARACDADRPRSTAARAVGVRCTRRSFDLAVELYEDGDWMAAFAAAAVGADARDAAAAKLALLMLRYGASIYGVELRAEPLRIARWAACVIAAASGAEQSEPPSPPAAPTRVAQRAPRSTSRRTASPSSITAIA